MPPWQAEVLGQYCCLGFQVPTDKQCARGWGDVWTGSSGMKDSDGKAGEYRGRREEHEFHWDVLDWWLTWGRESFSLRKLFP